MNATSEALVVPTELVDVLTGETLPASPANAHRALMAIKDLQARLRDVRANVDFYLAEESKRQGTQTFNVDGGQIVLSGGKSGIDYELTVLEELLREAGCPEERIREVIKEEQVTTYKLDRSVLKQLTAANPDYKTAAELAEREVERSLRVSVK